MKLGKKCISLMLALVMILGLTISASAAETETVTVQLSPNITVTLNGEIQTMTDVNGNPVYPVLYGGTTYLPIRAVGNMLGLDVDWDGATQTVILEKSDSTTAPAKTGGKAPTDAKPAEITVQINPNITVKYNGKAQAMTDVNGNPVYPMLYGGTTYLPVRAVSNMLGVKVDWDGATQTVLLTNAATSTEENKGEIVLTALDENKNAVEIGLSDQDKARKELTELGWTDDYITQAFESLRVARLLMDIPKTYGIDEKGNPYVIGPSSANPAETIDQLLKDPTFVQTLEDLNSDPDSKNLLETMRTSADAKTLGENHIGYDWAEIDWSMADKGYVRVKANEQLTTYTRCTVHWYEEKVEDWDTHNKSKSYAIPEGKWTNIPLTGSGKEYAVSIEQGMSEDENPFTGATTNEEFEKLSANLRPTLQARFTGETIDENALWLLSYGWVDYENAPEVCAKAQELTKDCKTDAEKITVIFEYVAKTIKYDQAKYEKNIADTIAIRTGEKGPIDPLLESLENRQTLSETMSSKKGVCDDYARLMAAMLRSVGVPCKVCSGDVYTGEIIKNYSDDGWVGHAWVAVKPKTGTLDMKALGAGKDYAPIQIGESYNENPTGWIRLDPTWGDTSSGRAAAAVDKNHRTDDCY